MGRPADAAVARRQPVADVLPRQRSTGPRRRSTSSVLVDADRARLVRWSVTGLDKRLVADDHRRARSRPRRRPRSPRSPPVAAARLLVLRNYLVYRDAWKLFLTGFLEPVFYLLSIGIGVGQLIDAFEFNGQAIPYAEFVAPGMLAASAFNGALLDSTFNVFFKLKFEKLYDQMLATPLSTSDIARGEIIWGQLRGGAYSAGVPRGDGGDGDAALVVGGARAAGGAADRLRVQRRLHGR